MKKIITILLAITFLLGCAQLSAEPAKAQQPAIDPAKFQERIAALDKSLPEAQAKAESTKEWATYKAKAEEAQKLLESVKATKEFKAYQQLVNERKYLEAFADKK